MERLSAAVKQELTNNIQTRLGKLKLLGREYFADTFIRQQIKDLVTAVLVADTPERLLAFAAEYDHAFPPQKDKQSYIESFTERYNQVTQEAAQSQDPLLHNFLTDIKPEVAQRLALARFLRSPYQRHSAALADYCGELTARVINIATHNKPIEKAPPL